MKTLFHFQPRENGTRQNEMDDPLYSTLNGKVVIVTGASSGIGQALAVRLAGLGCKVVLASRNYLKLEELSCHIRSRGGMATVITTDVTSKNDCKNLIDETIRNHQKLDILVNNAGISMRACFLDVQLEVLEKVMATNFWGTVYCTKYALPHLLESGGSLVAISSIGGITPLPGRTGYAASKHALDGFMDTIRVENRKNNLHVLTVHAGFTASEIRKNSLNKDGLMQAESPREENKMMSAAKVAAHVASAIASHKRDVILTKQGKIISWLFKRFPSVAETLIYDEMAREKGAPF